VLAALERRTDIRLAHREDVDLPGAIAIGRTLVDTPYFAELDDDDELLPQALATRLQRMTVDPSLDVVVSNGFLRVQGRDVVALPDIVRLQADPLRALFARMWLVPCSSLYRTDRVTLDLFQGMPRYLEWTYLALRLALSRKISFMDVPTFLYNRDTKDSLSKSRESVLGQPAALRVLMRLVVPPDVRRLLRRRYVDALHSASDAELADGNRLRAWGWHVRTLICSGGWRYLSYTRHLCRPKGRSRSSSVTSPDPEKHEAP
jgi:hypothetical protein